MCNKNIKTNFLTKIYEKMKDDSNQITIIIRVLTLFSSIFIACFVYNINREQLKNNQRSSSAYVMPNKVSKINKLIVENNIFDSGIPIKNFGKTAALDVFANVIYIFTPVTTNKEIAEKEAKNYSITNDYNPKNSVKIYLNKGKLKFPFEYLGFIPPNGSEIIHLNYKQYSAIKKIQENEDKIGKYILVIKVTIFYKNLVGRKYESKFMYWHNPFNPDKNDSNIENTINPSYDKIIHLK